jgi:hypothetical protein
MTPSIDVVLSQARRDLPTVPNLSDLTGPHEQIARAFQNLFSELRDLCLLLPTLDESLVWAVRDALCDADLGVIGAMRATDNRLKQIHEERDREPQ